MNRNLKVQFDKVTAIADFIRASHAAGAIDDYNGACLLQYLRLNAEKFVASHLEAPEDAPNPYGFIATCEGLDIYAKNPTSTTVRDKIRDRLASDAAKELEDLRVVVKHRVEGFPLDNLERALGMKWTEYYGRKG